MRALRKQRSVQAVRTSHHVIPCADIPQKIATIRFNAEVQYDGRGWRISQLENIRIQPFRTVTSFLNIAQYSEFVFI
jgi:hypothetical protein